MAYYADEDDVYKCPKHPLKRHRNNGGVCPQCLKERLSALCPDCASLRPCSCSSVSCSSSESSSFSIYFPDGPTKPVSTLIQTESPFPRRSAFPFFRSARFSSSSSVVTAAAAAPPSSASLWSVFRRGNSVKEKLTRSKSVVVGKDVVVAKRAVGKVSRWYFPSPMKVFRRSKASKVDQDRSPFHRGC